MSEKPTKSGQRRAGYYTVAEAARILGVHEDTIRRRGDAGRIPQEITAGHMAQRLYPRKAIDKLAEEKALFDRVWAEWEAEEIINGLDGRERSKA